MVRIGRDLSSYGRISFSCCCYFCAFLSLLNWIHAIVWYCLSLLRLVSKISLLISNSNSIVLSKLACVVRITGHLCFYGIISFFLLLLSLRFSVVIGLYGVG